MPESIYNIYNSTILAVASHSQSTPSVTKSLAYRITHRITMVGNGVVVKEGKAWWLHVMEQRRKAKRTLPMENTAIDVTTQSTTTQTSQRHETPHQQPNGKTTRQDAPPHPLPTPTTPPPIKGWTPPPSRTACRLIAAQEMQAFYARQKHRTYLRLPRVPPAGQDDGHIHGSSIKTLSMRRAKSLAASMRHGSKTSGTRRHYTAKELQTMHWAQQHAIDQMEQWQCEATGGGADHEVGDAQQGGGSEGEEDGGMVMRGHVVDDDDDEDGEEIVDDMVPSMPAMYGGAAGGCMYMVAPSQCIILHRPQVVSSTQGSVDAATRLQVLTSRIAAVRALSH